MNIRYFKVIKLGEHFVLISNAFPENYQLKDYGGRLGVRIGIGLSAESTENARYYYSALAMEGADATKKVLDIGIYGDVAYGLYLIEKKTGQVDKDETRKIRLLHNPDWEPVGFMNHNPRCKNCHSKHYISYDSAWLSTDNCQSCGDFEYVS